MALNSFVRVDCKYEFEDLWPYETAIRNTPVWGGPAKSKFGIPGLKFKGSGFHETACGKYGGR